MQRSVALLAVHHGAELEPLLEADPAGGIDPTHGCKISEEAVLLHTLHRR